MLRKTQATEVGGISFRLDLLGSFILFLSLLLVLRLAYLQLSQFKRYHTLSLKNQVSIIPIPPPRGIILDRKGVVLAENIPIYALEVIPEHVKNLPQSFDKLKQLLPSITQDDIEQFYRARKQTRSFVPIPLKLKLSQEEVAIFASQQYQFPGISIKARLMRFYPLGEEMAHVLGYVGRINPQELQQVDAANYRATTVIGKSGIEKFYEPQLHGQIGYQQVETDANGRTVRVLTKKNPTSGHKLQLTLDANLQQVAYHALAGKQGAVVAIDPRNGGVLAMASAPSFNANAFVNGLSATDYRMLVTAPDKPLYNRAIRGLYPPASTIKPFIGLLGLDKGVINPQYTLYDPGWFRLPGVSHTYRDWKKNGHGMMNLKRAITVSCDTYFYQLGYKLGITAIEDLLVQFGFGQLSHVDLTEEIAGLVPSKRWKLTNKGVAWFLGDTVITAIGQGAVLSSPLQLANAVASLSTNGKRFRPHLLETTLNANDDTRNHYKPLEEYPVHIKESSHWRLIKEAMQSVILEQEGTGYRFGRTAPYSVAGKTGTAQVANGKHYEKTRYEDIPVHLRDHSLFIAFAPVENPKIAIAVIVEHDLAAANIARKVLDTYFSTENGLMFNEK
ncbi:MAG: penicillin-binding protein 2 [Legionella sp.]|nr:penicillin-binding protein 2 [Legionella sp.]